MSKKAFMGWDRGMKRWQKRYRGKLHVVSPRQLGLHERTKEATTEAANQWWISKKQEIDAAYRPELPGWVEPRLDSAYDIPPQIANLMEQGSKTKDDEMVFADVALTSWSSMGVELARLAIPVLAAFNYAEVAYPYGTF